MIEDKAMILTLDSKDLTLDLFGDVSFVGLFSVRDKHDPVVVKSIAGLLLNFGGLSIFWSSKLQSKILLPTLEAEYSVLL